MSERQEDPLRQFTNILAGFGEALGAMRARMIDAGVPEQVADRVLSEVTREFTRAWSRPRYGLGLRSQG